MRFTMQLGQNETKSSVSEDHHGKERKINMKKYIEAKIDGEWCIIDQMDITEDATFSIQNENGDPTYYKIDDYELRIVRYEN